MTITHTSGLDERALMGAANRGDRAAFDELFDRHGQAAWRVAMAVAGRADDAASAVSDAFGRVIARPDAAPFTVDGPFRPLLLGATRAAAIDAARRRATETSGDDPDPRTPEVAALTGDDGAAISAAFASLPERWRSALWLIEVEGVEPARAAAVLEMSPKAADQLAGRARAGLRERYARAQAPATDGEECRRAMSHLGSFASGRMGRRDRRRLADHLGDCERCDLHAAAIDDAVPHLRRLAVPLPATLAAQVADAWEQTKVAQRGPLGLALPGGRPVAPWAERVLAGSTAAVVALGLAGAIAFGARDVGSKDSKSGRLASGSSAADDELALGETPDLTPIDLPAAPALPIVDLRDAGSTPAPAASASGAAAAPAPATETARSSGSATTPTTQAPKQESPPTTDPLVPPPEVKPEETPSTTLPPIIIDAGALGGASVSDSCTGAELLDVTLLCDPDDADGTTVTLLP